MNIDYKKDKKNCSDNKFVNKINSQEEFIEYREALDKIEEAKNVLKIKNSIVWYFGAIHSLSNAILLNKYKIRSKSSQCSYYKLYLENIISKDLYDKIEEIRENRNLINYNPHQSLFLNDDDINNICKLAIEILNELKNIYEND